MKISNCIDDFKTSIAWSVMAFIGEIVCCLALSWNMFAVYTFIIINVILLLNCIIDWLYFGRSFILDSTGCMFVFGKHTRKYTWTEIHIQHIKNNGYLFGDSEIPSEGIILSTKPISKSPWLGAMTYCRFRHPFACVFIRFHSQLDTYPKTSAKHVYQGFDADENEITEFLKSIGKWNNPNSCQ